MGIISDDGKSSIEKETKKEPFQVTSLDGDSDIAAYCSTPSELTPETTPETTPDTTPETTPDTSGREVKTSCDDVVIDIDDNKIESLSDAIDNSVLFQAS